REELWTRVPKDALPVEIPLADVDQPLSGSIGQRRVTLDLLGEEMRVRLNGVQVDVHVHRKRVSDDISTLAGRDVHVLPGHPDEGRLKPRWRVAEVQPQLWLNGLCVPGRPEVQHEDQVGPDWERP